MDEHDLLYQVYLIVYMNECPDDYNENFSDKLIEDIRYTAAECLGAIDRKGCPQPQSQEDVLERLYALCTGPGPEKLEKVREKYEKLAIISEGSVRWKPNWQKEG